MRIKVRLPAGIEGAGEARRALDALGRETSHEVLSTVELLVSELVANSPHRRVVDPEDDGILLEIETSRTSIHTEIIHLGTGETIRTTPDEDLNKAWDVVLLDELSSRWGVIEDSDSNEGVWFEIDRWAPDV